MITINQKREACIQYETDWLQETDREEKDWILRHGWKGWKNATDEEVEKFYKDNIEEEVR